MQKKIEKLFKNRLVSGSAIVFIGGMFASFFNYLFHLLVGRILGPERYAVLASLTALLYFGEVPASTVGLISTKFASTFKAKKEMDRLKLFLLKITQVLLLIGFFVFLFFVLSQNWLARFLKIEDSSLFVLLGGVFLFTFLGAANNGLLRGFQKFFFLSANSTASAFFKLALGGFLVWKGFGVRGALVAFLISAFFPYVFSFVPLRFLFSSRIKKAREKVFLKKIWAFTVPTFFSILGMNFFYTMDVVLVKHFFAEFEAGLYSAASLAGKAILFATSPVISVMFPLVSESYAKKEDFKKFFHLTLLLVFGASLTVTLGYLLFPRLVILLFFGQKFLGAEYLIGRFAVFIFLYTLASAFVNFFLSIHKIQIAFFPILASLSQIALIFLFHSSLSLVISISTVVSLLLLISLGGFYLKVVK